MTPLDNSSNTATAVTSIHGGMDADFNGTFFSGLNGFGNQQLNFPDGTNPMFNLSSMASFGQLIKRSLTLSTSSETQFDLYCEKTISSYVKAFFLSPTITSYRGNCAEQILNAMVDLNVGGLPPAKNHLQIAEVISLIKLKIQASLTTPTNKAANTCNVADLTHSLISNTQIVPTLQLWMRMAFLRSQAADATALSKSFNALYEADKKKYGDPASTRHNLVQPRDILGWLRTIDAHAFKVKAPVAGGVRKRKRQEDEVEETEIST
ncbi:hypothetical protein BDN70DRAFT_902312 [Pholiota conissans]|uniref:Uncharacterized protein n=1 Tax=Pholiota conissans TaxID=109636 RepID=A0A9P5YHX0_9AGAR|nr:hypothetical protein BDN70DRAFT_902312 [Pholiota conissans]